MGNKQGKELISQDPDTSVKSTTSVSSHSALKGSPNSKVSLGLRSNNSDSKVSFGARTEEELPGHLSDIAKSRWVEVGKQNLGRTGGLAEKREVSTYTDAEKARKISSIKRFNKNHSRREGENRAMNEILSNDINGFVNYEFNANDNKNNDTLVIGRKILEALSEKKYPEVVEDIDSDGKPYMKYNPSNYLSFPRYLRGKNGAWSGIAQHLESNDKKSEVDYVGMSLDESSNQKYNVDGSEVYYDHKAIKGFFEELGKHVLSKDDSVSKRTRRQIVEQDGENSYAEQYRNYVYESAYKQSKQEHSSSCAII